MPICGSYNFWASRIMFYWDSTIPSAAFSYLDTGVTDPCIYGDFTIGILLPVLMDAGVYETEIRTLQGAMEDSPYILRAQKMGKLFGGACSNKWCVGDPGAFGSLGQLLVPRIRPDESERTVPIEFCTGWSIFETSETEPFVDEAACDP